MRRIHDIVSLVFCAAIFAPLGGVSCSSSESTGGQPAGGASGNGGSSDGSAAGGAGGSGGSATNGSGGSATNGSGGAGVSGSSGAGGTPGAGGSSDAGSAGRGVDASSADGRGREASVADATSDGNGIPVGSDGGRLAPSTDPATFGLNGASKCTQGGFAVCEDFESTVVGALPTGWTREGTWAMAVSTAEKARGTHSLQVQVGTLNNQRGFLLKTKAQLGDLAVKHFGRMFFNMQNPTASFVHWDFFHGNGPFGGGTNDVRWGFTGTNTVTYLFNVQTSGNGEFGTNSRDMLTFSRWVCAEWSLDSTVAGGGESRFWLNGTEVPVFHRTGTAAQIPVFDRYGVGWELFNSGTTPSVAYIDEVVFDSARIGCNN